MSSDAVIKRMAERFSLISDFSAAARITVHYSREDLLLGEIFESKQVTKSTGESKNNINLTEWHVFLNCASQTRSQIERRFTCIEQHAH